MDKEEKRIFDRNVATINTEFENISKGLISKEHWQKEFEAIKALLSECEEIALAKN